MGAEELKIKSVSQYIDCVKDNFQYLKTPDELFCLWFRGEGCTSGTTTPIVPKAFRDFGGPLDNEQLNTHVFEQAKGIESNIIAAFSRESFRFLARNGISAESWNHYVLMQHYGLKTRLLDWTENALLALFFAVCDRKFENEDGRVWLLSPLRLNSFTIETICGKCIHAMGIPENVKERSTLINNQSKNLNIDELYRRYLKLDLVNYPGEELNNKYFPLAIYPNLLDERMSAQQSCFTIFGNEVNGLALAEKKNDFLASVVVDAKMKRAIKEELKWLGVTYKMMFPDLEGICMAIEDHVNIDHLIFKRIK